MAHQRYVFYYAMGAGTRAAVRAAQMTASALGATVIKVGMGTLLVEATQAKAAELANALPEWRHAQERLTTQLPESEALQRTRQKLAATQPKRK